MKSECSEFNAGKEVLNDTYVDAVQKEYAKLDEKWLQLHYKTAVGLLFFSLFTELVLGLLVVRSDMLTTTVTRFFLKFLIIPGCINILLVAAGTLIMKSKNFPYTLKMYFISLILVGISFVLFTVHIAFDAVYFIFAITIMLTVTYANYRLTSITALASILSIVLSELFITWDVDKVSVFQSTNQLSEFLVSLFVLTAFSIACLAVVRLEREKNSAGIQKELERQQLQQSLLIDEMTGIYNRKAFHDRLTDLGDTPLERQYILAIVDIDRFKKINDTWGHYIGDYCLTQFAQILKEYQNKLTPYRYGGDEFCLVFCDMEMVDAKYICEDIQMKVNNLSFEDCPTLNLTISIGLASNADTVDSVRLFVHADEALYNAKKIRNAIRVFGS